MRRIVEELGFVPKTCTWELTRSCSLRCGHCGSRAGTPREQELSPARAHEVVHELRALGCEQLTLSGGEPTDAPHWQHVAETASQLGMEVRMITNGLLDARVLIRRARDAGVRALGTSLDGLQSTHDRNRARQGHFRKTIELLEVAQAEGFPISAITAITRENMHELPALSEVIEGKCYAWQLQLGVAMGQLSDRRDVVLAPSDLLALVPTIAQLIQIGRSNIVVADNIGYYGPHETVLRSKRPNSLPCWVGCYAGCRQLGIEADGGVKGCLSLQCTTQSEGNLARESLSNIWHRPGAFAYNRDFKFSDLNAFCRACDYAETCRGGCYCMRLSAGQGHHNPYCYHRVAMMAARGMRSPARYRPIAIMPTALLAMAVNGCWSASDDLYDCPPEYCGHSAGVSSGGTAKGGQNSGAGTNAGRGGTAHAGAGGTTHAGAAGTNRSVAGSAGVTHAEAGAGVDSGAGTAGSGGTVEFGGQLQSVGQAGSS